MILLFFLYFTISIIFIIYTPQIISDNIYGIVFGNCSFNYKEQDNHYSHNYIFNHKKYDGELMSYNIKNKLYNYNVINDFKMYSFKPYQYIKTNRIKHYSLFTSAISNMVNTILKNQKRSFKIGIVVSTRHLMNNKTKKGNFIKLAIYQVNIGDNLLDICQKHHNSVYKIKTKKHIKNNTCIFDIITALGCNYVFNSWRNLSKIVTVDNKILIRKNDGDLFKRDIIKFLNIPALYYITLDFINNKYIISNLFRI